MLARLQHAIADLLGLREVPRPAELAGRPGLWFERGAVRVHVGVEEVEGVPSQRIDFGPGASKDDSLAGRFAEAMARTKGPFLNS